MVGQTISHYRIIEKLGEGGMGVVYLAEDTHLARKVAIKFLLTLDQPYRARFLREARAVSKLTHANIAAVYDYGETPEGHPYIVMELVKGPTLGELLEGEQLTLTRSVQVVISIAEALAEAHHYGIVHRDIKPSNVVVTERNQVKVLDFGLVKQIEEPAVSHADPNARTHISTHTRSDVIVGTPLYLSPEQATGKPVDGRSDLFALGSLLYECTTGQPAFSGGSVIEIGAQVIHVNPKPPSNVNPGIPPELDRITMKALEKNLESRYQSAEEMSTDLRDVLSTLSSDQSHGPLHPARLTSASRPLRTSALTTLTRTLRQPRVSFGTLAIAAVLIAVGVGLLFLILRPSPYQTNPVAQDWYMKGIEAMRNGLFLQAKLAFEQAVIADPKYPLAHARLAEALTELDYGDDARNEMFKVTELVPNRSQLPRVEGLYIDALRSTVALRDYPAAIQAYREIATLSPNDAQVYFDLGRAYEKNDDFKNAIESYIETTNRSPQLAAAFLRVAVLYGRQLGHSSASANFQKAETLYQALGSIEGQAEVSYERGFLFNQLNNIAEARVHLHRALELARTVRNQYQEVKTLLKLGDVAGDEGKVDEARKLMREAIDLARTHKIDNFTKRGLVDLGNTYLRSGDYQEAKAYFEESLELAQKQKDTRNEARALLSLASLAERLGNPDEAKKLVDRALPFYRMGGYRKEMSQAMALLARSRLLKGEYEAALLAFKEQLEVAKQLGDQSQVATIHMDIGNVLTCSARYPEALVHLEQSNSITKSLGIQKEISLSLANYAGALWRLGRYDKAQSSLKEASIITDQANAAKNEAAWYHLAVARMALSERKFPLAKQEAQKALGLGDTFKGTTTEANYTSGLAHALSGSLREGKSKCEAAVEIGAEQSNPIYLSEALLALAEVDILAGDHQSALTAALRSQEMLARLGKQDSEWIAWLIAARASRSNRDDVKSREYATRANDLLSGLLQKWGPENYNSYLNRPDIQFLRQQLSDLLS